MRKQFRLDYDEKDISRAVEKDAESAYPGHKAKATVETGATTNGYGQAEMQVPYVKVVVVMKAKEAGKS